MALPGIGSLWGVVLIAMLPALAAAESAKGVWAGDERVLQKVAVNAEGVPAGDLFEQLSDKTRVSLTAGPDSADEKVVVLGPARPMRDLLDDLAELLNSYWERRKAADGTLKYRLERGIAARQLEARLVRDEIDRMLAQLAEQARALAETPEQLQRRPANDPIRRTLEDTRFGGRPATLLYSWLTPQQREQLFAQNRFHVDFRSLSPQQQVAVQQIFNDLLAREQADARDRQARDPRARGTLGRPEDLDRFGIAFTIVRQNGSTSASVRVGNTGYVSLGNLNNPRGFPLPAHGNPYTSAAVPASALLPSAAITTAASANVPWPERLRKLAEGSGIALVADYYRTPAVRRPPGSAGAGQLPRSPTEALDALCRRDGYMWWTRGETLLLRKRDWFAQRLREVPDRWLLATIRRLQTQDGLPTGADVLHVQELTIPQITGLNLLGERYLDESFYDGLPELLALVDAAPQTPRGPLAIGDFAYSVQDVATANRSSLIQDTLTPRQQTLFTRLLALQHGSVVPGALGGKLTVRLYCRSREPKVTASGYRYLDVGIHWDLMRRVTASAGVGFGAGYDLYLPLSLPDDRRDRTKIELVP
jgi:hypothetical protein